MKIIKPPKLLKLLWLLEGLADALTFDHAYWFHPSEKLEQKYCDKVKEERECQKEEIDDKTT